MRLNELKNELLRRPAQSDGKGFYQRQVQQPVLPAGEETDFPVCFCHFIYHC
jgi:hypothetical protein